MDLLSVVVCTYNRSASLREMLESLSSQQAEGFDYEVVVVDNNSSDDTKAVVADLPQALRSRIRYVFEPQQGLSYARNTGVRAAHGSVVAFTDDDVRPDARWLSSLYAAFQTFEADCVYGKVLPLWLEERPGWLGPYFVHRLAMLDRGETPFLATSTREQFVGANFSIRKDTIVKLGGFNVRLGNRGTQIGGEEDTELFNRLLASGATIAYTPEAVVRHKVAPERMTPAYFRKWHFEHGAAAAHTTAVERGKGVLGIPFWAFKDFVIHAAGWGASSLSPNAEQHLIHEMTVLYNLGFFAEKTRRLFRSNHS